MQLTTLEFPKILERLANHAMFSASKELALALQPTPYFAEAQERQTETTEAVKLLSVKDNISVGAARDVRPYVERAYRGMVLLTEELVQVQQTLISARALQRTFSRLADEYPRLADIAQRMESCPGIISHISNAIDERGEVRNSASPKLNHIRRELESVHGRLLEKLNRLVMSPRYARYLQDPIVTQREGRYVVPLKAEFKGKIQGVVHDQSGSGMTLFIEPLATVELNNRWRQLQLDEADEIRRILAALSAQVAEQGPAIQHTVAALADLDLTFAKAKYAAAIDATAPQLFDSEAPDSDFFCLPAARHPLLDAKTVVPIDVSLPHDTHILVITGPNTGGKTVSLKTVGLLSAMAQAGLWLPVEEGCRLPVFSNIFADIGDEQSIEQSLSTFSAHMTNVVRILTSCDHRSLVIFDELGAGTDPIEGSALARAILSHLLDRRVTTFVATHYSELKAYAHGTPGVLNASMAFDLESLAPTYRLQIGLPGASNAFTISQRLGLPQEIINQARGLVSEENQQVEVMLAQIKTESETAQQLRRQLDQQRQSLEQRLANIEAEKQDILNSARADARREIKAAREQIRALQQQAEAELKALTARAEQEKVKIEASQTSESVAEIEEQLETLAEEIQTKREPPPPSPAPPPAESIQAGDTVYIAQYSTEGQVIAIQRKQVEVQLGHFRTTVPLAEVTLREKAQPQPTEKTAPTVRTPDVASPGMELDLRGQVPTDALQKLEAYLDRAFMARLPWVRIIHGKGSGVLRQVVRQALSGHALIASYRSGEIGEGGDGVTVAKLALSSGAE